MRFIENMFFLTFGTFSGILALQPSLAQFKAAVDNLPEVQMGGMLLLFLGSVCLWLLTKTPLYEKFHQRRVEARARAREEIDRQEREEELSDHMIIPSAVNFYWNAATWVDAISIRADLAAKPMVDFLEERGIQNPSVKIRHGEVQIPKHVLERLSGEDRAEFVLRFAGGR